MMHQTVLILDFGGQYKELIARRVRECNVYSEVYPGDISIEKIKALRPIGIILTGGPHSVYAKDAPKPDAELFHLGIPILGICYGAQLIAQMNGGRVEPCSISEYGQRKIKIKADSPLFEGLDKEQIVLMSHTDQIQELPEGFFVTASSETCPNVAIESVEKSLYGVQFHPETELTIHGEQIIRNFLYQICHAEGDYTLENFIGEQIRSIREQIGDEKVILGLSGGVDSAVCAALLAEAVPGQAICIFVDHGMMRKNEGNEVEKAFATKSLEFIRVDAADRFLSKLAGVIDPEQKRKIIGNEFIQVFSEQAMLHDDAKFLAQGTIYPDVIESGNGKAATIKSHHNVGGLPKDLNFKGIVEPLRSLFKDEVRQLGSALGLPQSIVNRQPFPGPGLGVRIIGEITREKLHILQEADAIFREEVEADCVPANQYFAVLTNLRSVGVMGDSRTYDYTLALRAVITHDFMTAEYAPIPHTTLSRLSKRITNEVKGINRIVYDITDKPPATIEWE